MIVRSTAMLAGASAANRACTSSSSLTTQPLVPHWPTYDQSEIEQLFIEPHYYPDPRGTGVTFSDKVFQGLYPLLHIQEQRLLLRSSLV